MRHKEQSMPTTWSIFWLKTFYQMQMPVMNKALQIVSWTPTMALNLMNGIGTQIYSVMTAHQCTGAKLKMIMIRRDQIKMVIYSWEMQQPYKIALTLQIKLLLSKLKFHSEKFKKILTTFNKVLLKKSLNLMLPTIQDVIKIASTLLLEVDTHKLLQISLVQF